MRRLVYLAVTLASLLFYSPLPGLAWQRAVHDDGGPYRDLAVAAVGQWVAVAVSTPASIELTVLGSDGSRRAWATVPLPEEAWAHSQHQLSLSLRRDRRQLYVAVGLSVGDNVATQYAYVAGVVVERHGRSFTAVLDGPPTAVSVPAGALALTVARFGEQTYLVWRVEDEDGTSTVLVGTHER